MTSFKKKEVGGVSPVLAAVAGVVVGAGAVVAGALAIGRDKIDEKVSDIADKTKVGINKVGRVAELVKEEVKNTKEEVKKTWNK